MNVFDLQARIGLNTTEYKKGLSEAGKSFSEFGSKVKDGTAKLAKIGTAAIAGAATGVAALVKQSVSAYGEYEQLVGGIETLFGESAKKVLESSEKAFATAGMDVNTYMETAIQGAASLINSLGGDTAKAADLMDMSIQDMSDNVNKMGTNMESIQNAYRGFSRGNFTMLDNLALGFAGSKAGMEELLEKAQQISGVQYDIESYADIVQAIHVVQQQMGITGTTAKEASGTITGSMASVKAAWKNLTIEMAKSDGDVGKAFKVLGDNVGAVMENMLPRVEQAISGVGELVKAAAPQISKAISELIPKLLPSIIKSGASLVTSVTKGLIQAAPELLNATSGIMKELFNSFMGTDLGVFEWLKEDLSHIVGSVKGLFGRIDLAGLKDKFVDIGTAVSGLFDRAGDAAIYLFDNALSPLAEWVANSNFLDGIAAGFQLIGSAVDILKTPAKAVWEEFLKPILSTAADVWDVAAGGLKKLADSLNGIDWEGYWIDMFDGHFGEDWKIGWQAIYDAFAQGGEAIDDFFNVSSLGAGWNSFWQGVGETVFNIKTGIMGAIDTMESAMERVFGKIKETEADFNTDINTGYIVRNGQVITIDPTQNPEMYKKYNPQAYERWYKNYGSIAKKAGFDVPTPFANGGRVTRPTLALIGEKEPETVVPDSKREAFGNTTNYITINVDGYNIKNDEEFTELLSRKLSELSVRQQRAVGGAGW